MGLFGRKEVTPEKPERPPAPPALAKVKVVNSEGKVIYEVDLIAEYTTIDETYVRGTTPNEKIITVMPGTNLLVMEEDAEDEEDE